MNPKVQIIPAKLEMVNKKIGIYCRVSSNTMEQLNSLTAQISHYIRQVSYPKKWNLVDAYIDIATSKSGSERKEFQRMLKDCHSKKIDIILTKSISRFGRDTVEVIDALNQLKLLGVRIIFEQEGLDLSEDNNPAIISRMMFDAVQQEKKGRSNVVVDERGKRRKDSKYSSKRRKDIN